MLKVTKTIDFQQKKKLQEFVKMGKKSQKPYLTNFNLLIVHGLWQAHYQIPSIIFLNEVTKLNYKL